MNKKWMQSKSGLWHLVDNTWRGNVLPMCQSYNLDRPNILHGEALDVPPVGAKICKKCLSHVNK